MRRRTYKYTPFEILRVIRRQSLPGCFYDRGGYANADSFDEIFMFVFYLCAVLLLDACGVSVRFVFFVGGCWWLYVATILWGLCAVPKKRVFGPKTAKIMKIALFWPQNFEKWRISAALRRFLG